MREAEIREEIWKIIDEETRKRFGKHALDVDVVMSNIRIRINELLNKHEAILVYQP